MLPPIKIRTNTSDSNGVSSSVYRQRALMLPHLGQRYRKARRDSAGAKSRRTKLLPPSRFSVHGFRVRRIATGAAALLPPRPPAAPAVLERQPLGLALWSYGNP